MLKLFKFMLAGYHNTLFNHRTDPGETPNQTHIEPKSSQNYTLFFKLQKKHQICHVHSVSDSFSAVAQSLTIY